ncbi:unnamed protein product [Rotaria sordida]|uniref:Uncharacterized protein n=2 Tax=Rotaria sordida TaxID=392033 RepID=A0A814DRH6_9BILA|nr:unnamed protein product [Rotaria sordida]
MRENKMMNDKNKEIGFNSEDENEKNCTMQFNKVWSDMSDYYINLINSASDNIEQPTKKCNDSSVDLSANNEQCLTTASNTRVETSWLIHIDKNTVEIAQKQ